MKNVLFLMLSFLLVGSIYAENPKAALFELNEAQIDAQISDLNDLENYVNSNQGVTLSEVMNFANEGEVNLSVNMLDNFAAVLAEHPVAGIPSFLWGCILGPVGIAIVHFDAEDKEQTKKAIWGCVALGGVYALLVAASYIFAFSAYPF